MLLVPHRPSVLKVFRCKIWGDRVVQVSVQFSRYTSRHMLLSSQMNRCNTLDVHALSGSPFHLMSSSFCTFTYILNRLVLMFMVIILKSAFFVGFLIISILANAYYVPPPIFSSSQLPHLTLFSFFICILPSNNWRCFFREYTCETLFSVLTVPNTTARTDRSGVCHWDANVRPVSGRLCD